MRVHPISLSLPSLQTRTGHVYSAWEVIPCPKDFNYEVLLVKSSTKEPTVQDNDLEEPHSGSHTAPHAAPSLLSLLNPFTSTMPHLSPTKMHSDPSKCKKTAVDRATKQPKKQSAKNACQRQLCHMLKAKVGVLPTSPYVEKIAKPATTLPIPLDYHNLPVMAGAYSAKNLKIPNANTVYTKEQLVDEMGFTYVAWTGW